MKKKAADIFLVAGGGESRRPGGDPLLAQIFSLIGREKPEVAYIGAASRDSRIFFKWMSAQLKKAGAGPVRLVGLASGRADLAAARSLLAGADLVFVSGGDVESGMRILARNDLTALLKDLHQCGKPFAGLSAGSIMLAQSWVRWADAADDASAQVFPCLGLAPLLCDTHAEKEEWEELKALLRLTGAPVGYGIPAGAALRVAADGSVLALGKPVRRLAWRRGRAENIGDLPVS